MDEEQCHRPRERWNMRPPRGVREKEDYRNSGAGHEIHLEIEDVLDKINKCAFKYLYVGRGAI